MSCLVAILWFQWFIRYPQHKARVCPSLQRNKKAGFTLCHFSLIILQAFTFVLALTSYFFSFFLSPQLHQPGGRHMLRPFANVKVKCF